MDNKNSRYEHIIHPFPPLYDEDSRILILGSLPSVKSREQMFFYGHKQNRFWKVMANVLHYKHGDEIWVPSTIEEKQAMLHKHRIALWDAIHSREIIGSSDRSIKTVNPIREQTRITKVFCNGATSAKYYKKYQEKELGIKAVTLPSTSPANAAYSVDRLVAIWTEKLCEYL